MTREQPGLRLRLKNGALRISSQHAQLGSFYTMVTGAIERGAPHSALAAFTRLHDALEAHFAVEDGLYFPAVRGLHPEFERELTELVSQHQSFRSDLSRIQKLLQAFELEESGRQLARLVDDLSAHESREEAILVRITSPGPDGSGET